MPSFRAIVTTLSREKGHAMPIPGALVGGAGAILLAIGAANDTGVLTIIGGVVLAIGIMATLLLQHIGVEYGIYRRLDDIEQPKG